MIKLLERAIDAVNERLVLLAPPNASAHGHFRSVDVDADLHAHLMRGVQALRGGIYLEDGAITRQQLSPGGLHRTPEDEKSWHLVTMNDDNQPTACVWYFEHANTVSIDHLRVRNCALAGDAVWRDRFRSAIGAELARARRDGLRYAEVGGWAVTRDSRCTSEGLVLALAAYSLGRIAGGALGLTTATVRHASSSILRRLGGTHLEAHGQIVPPYYDPRYKCEMELLRFDSRRPSAKYAGLIESLKDRLACVPVVASTALVDPFEYAERGTPASALFAA